MELDLNEFGKRYVTYTTYLFNGILVLGAVFIAITFLAPGETVGEIFLAIQIFSGIIFWLLPIAIVLAIIKRTRKVGGAFLYSIAVVQLAYWWITALLLLQDKGGTWWAVIGIVSSIVTAGFGIFAVTVINAIIHGSLTGVLMFIGIPIVCRLVSNLGKGLMEIHPQQIEGKIEALKLKKQKEIDDLDEEIAELESRVENAESVDDFIDADDYEDEIDDDLDDEYEELERLKTELREAQENEAKLREEYFETINEIAGDKNAAKEIFEEIYHNAELESGTPEYYTQQAHILWKEGRRERALVFFDKALPEMREEIRSNNDAITVMNRGNLQLELGNFDESILDLERAAEINPTLPTWNAQVLKMLKPEDRENMRQRILAKEQAD